MVSDNEGDLPLHYAACNGASPSLLRLLAAEDGSAAVRNSLGRLPIDEYIAWYLENLHDGYEELHERETDNESASDDDSEGSQSFSTVSGSCPRTKKDSDKVVESGSNNRRDGPEYHISNTFGFLLSDDNWERGLWDPMFVLIQSAALAATQLTGGERTNGQNMREELLTHPIHSAVIAIKYANYPALALVASIQRHGVNARTEENGNVGPSPLLEKDLHGKLPLHWACSTLPNTDNDGPDGAPLSPSTANCDAIARWNTNAYPCTVIEYLLHCEPDAARIPTLDGRLPLHLLVEDISSAWKSECIRQPWDDVKLLLRQYPESLGMRDPVSGLYPFQLAAASPPTSVDGPAEESMSGSDYIDHWSELLSLDMSHRLIMEDPAILCQIIEDRLHHQD